MEQLTCERLQDNLKRLKLIRAAEVLDTVVTHAEEGKSSYLGFLDRLLEEEVAAKEKRRIQTALKIAGLPFAKTIEEYDFTFHPHLDKKTVMELFDLTFLAKHENVIFLGPPGVGKTHLAIALAIKACSHGFRVCFTTMNTLIGKLKESQSKGKAYLSAAWSSSTRPATCPSRAARPICSSSSSRTATRRARRSSPRTKASATGRSSLAMPSSLRPSSTGSCITPGSSTSGATAIVSKSIRSANNFIPSKEVMPSPPIHRKELYCAGGGTLLRSQNWYTFKFPLKSGPPESE